MTGRFVGRFVGEKSKRAKAVNQYDLNGNLIKTWGATTDAQRSLGVNYTSIVRCCRGENITAGGFLWTYADDKNLISEKVAKAAIPKKLSREHKERIRDSMKGKPHYSIEKAVVGTNIKTGEKVYYRSMKMAENDGFSYSSISACISPKKPQSKTHKGYTWEYYNAEKTGA